jgi:hypothetical protein
MAKQKEKPTKEVAAPKKVPTTFHTLLKDYGNKKAKQKIELGANGVQFLRKNKFIK